MTDVYILSSYSHDLHRLGASGSLSVCKENDQLLNNKYGSMKCMTLSTDVSSCIIRTTAIATTVLAVNEEVQSEYAL